MPDPFLPISRRGMLKSSAALGALTIVPTVLSELAHAETRDMPADIAPQMLPVTLTINGQHHTLTLDTRTTLLDALRDHLHLTGSKKGCDHGQCGACTILVNEKRINSCLTLAVMHQTDAIQTIEGLAKGDELHPMQAAFVAHDGFQCGYCTPGQICSAIAMLREAKAGMPSHVSEFLDQEADTLSDAEIRERMSGNICRCAAYPNILDAIKQVEASS